VKVIGAVGGGNSFHGGQIQGLFNAGRDREGAKEDAKDWIGI
jgi:hypothetical protein